MSDDHTSDRPPGDRAARDDRAPGAGGAGAPGSDSHDDALTVAASAVVDGVATEAERALVESDPRGPALVERLRAVASTLAEVDPVDDAVREDHLATALAAFGTVGAVARPTSIDRPARSARWQRPPMRRALAAAAAIVAVATVGVVVANLDRATDDDASTADTFAAPADEEADDDALTMMAPDADDADLEERAGTLADDPAETGRTEAAPEVAADTAPADDGDVGDDAEPGDGAGGVVDVPIVGGADELAELGAEAVRNFEDDGPIGPLDPDGSDTSEMLPLDPAVEACLPEGALPIGPVVFEGWPAFAVVTVDAVSGRWDTVVAIDPTDCSVVAAVPLAASD